MSLPVPNSAPEVVHRTALVVDDVEDILDLIEIALQSAGFSVLRASSAATATDLFDARGEEIDLLMTDVRVGAESGFDLAQRFLAVKPSLQVLAMSGLAWDRKHSSRGRHLDFLQKPFSTSDLKKKLGLMFAPGPRCDAVTVAR